MTTNQPIQLPRWSFIIPEAALMLLIALLCLPVKEMFSRRLAMLERINTVRVAPPTTLVMGLPAAPRIYHSHAHGHCYCHCVIRSPRVVVYRQCLPARDGI